MSGKYTAVTIGKFECLHRGHQRLLANIVAQRENGLTSTVIAIETGESKQVLTREEKKSLLSRMGVSESIFLPMDQTLRSMEPEEFVKTVLSDRLHAAYVTAGVDFRFGRDRKGDGALLERLGRQYGFSVELAEKEKDNGRVISSSWIREELEKGEIPAANRLLGYHYFIGGRVVHGNRIGSRMKLPTMNLRPPKEKLLPPEGVYVSGTMTGGHLYPGITDIGYRPTVREEEKRLGVETHLFAFDQDTYGQQVYVTLREYLRPEKKFDDLACLKQQISEDIERGKHYFSQKS